MFSLIKGPAWMIAAGLGYTLASACARELSSEYTTVQLAFMRAVIAVVFISPLVLRHGVFILKTKVLPLHLLRSLFTYGGMICWFYAVSMISVSDYTALLYTQPIFTIFAATLILRETVGRRSWLAVAIAFIGALIIIRPGFQTVNLGMLAAIATGLLLAGVNTTVKLISREDSSIKITVYVSLFMLVFSAIPAAFVWKQPLLIDLPMIIGIGVFALFGQYAIAEAISIADARIVQPFDFSRLITASIIGWLAFGESSDVFTWIGALVIFGASYYVIAFERKGFH